jgi:hypothetical protein
MTHTFENLMLNAGNCTIYVAYLENAEKKFHPIPLFSLNWDTENSLFTYNLKFGHFLFP